MSAVILDEVGFSSSTSLSPNNVNMECSEIILPETDMESPAIKYALRFVNFPPKAGGNTTLPPGPISMKYMPTSLSGFAAQEFFGGDSACWDYIEISYLYYAFLRHNCQF